MMKTKTVKAKMAGRVKRKPAKTKAVRAARKVAKKKVAVVKRKQRAARELPVILPRAFGFTERELVVGWLHTLDANGSRVHADLARRIERGDHLR